MALAEIDTQRLLSIARAHPSPAMAEILPFVEILDRSTIWQLVETITPQGIVQKKVPIHWNELRVAPAFDTKNLMAFPVYMVVPWTSLAEKHQGSLNYPVENGMRYVRWQTQNHAFTQVDSQYFLDGMNVKPQITELLDIQGRVNKNGMFSSYGIRSHQNSFGVIFAECAITVNAHKEPYEVLQFQ